MVSFDWEPGIGGRDLLELGETQSWVNLRFDVGDEEEILRGFSGDSMGNYGGSDGDLEREILKSSEKTGSVERRRLFSFFDMTNRMEYQESASWRTG